MIDLNISAQLVHDFLIVVLIAFLDIFNYIYYSDFFVLQIQRASD